MLKYINAIVYVNCSSIFAEEITTNNNNLKKTNTMKKLLLFSFALLAASCSNDDNGSATSSDCDCGRILRCTSFNVLNPVGSPTPVRTVTMFVVLNNCTYNEITYNVSGDQTNSHPVGSQYCR